MEKITVKELNEKRFNAYASYTRSPAASFISKELAWYANEDESIIGVLLLDIIDLDYAAVVLGRDEGGSFRAFDMQHSFSDRESALQWLINTIKWNTGKGDKIFAQGDASKRLELFKPIIPREKMHPYFIHLSQNNAFAPAKELIENMMPSFVDIDGNFVEQFQSTGFDSRLWELYLYAYITEEQLFIERTYNAPDFLIKKYGKTVAIEAAIVSRNDNPPRYFMTHDDFITQDEISTKNENFMPIKFGSSLYSKLQKKYWELPHVKNNPLVLAIADFHDNLSMTWSSTALANYLFGIKHDFHYDENNQLVITPIKIDSHKLENKEIPSGFFFQENAEFISAVLFSANGTISKFNRMGRQAGFKTPSILMVRYGTCHDHNPNSIVPKVFRYIVDENSEETWGEGISMFHNPNARFPVSEELFPSIAHHHFKNGQIISKLPEFHPYSSVTFNFKSETKP